MAGWSSSRIVAELRIWNITQAQIARDEGVRVSAVNNMIHGRSKSKKLRSAVAKALNTPVEVIWPPNGDLHK